VQQERFHICPCEVSTSDVRHKNDPSTGLPKAQIEFQILPPNKAFVEQTHTIEHFSSVTPAKDGVDLYGLVDADSEMGTANTKSVIQNSNDGPADKCVSTRQRLYGPADIICILSAKALYAATDIVRVIFVVGTHPKDRVPTRITNAHIKSRGGNQLLVVKHLKKRML
jgi:hypothetical protein